ncbi:MAG: hypothetical protein HYZ16_12545 [Bacteroidetes bacterium]|jgi:gliding motility-associated protein GldM|nr:hypothetical protein [Bacteroidota bacterium]
MSVGNSNSQKLRQKAIGLLYLLFIALVFIYVPSDFLDSINETNRSLEKTSLELSGLKSGKFIMFEKEGFDLSINNLTDSFKYRFISQVSDTAYNRIARIKQFLINETGGYNEFGYPKKSKEFDITDHLMLNSNRATNLKKSILEFKNNIRPYLSDGQESILDSILVIKENVVASNGKAIAWEKFYFKKAPLSVTQMMLSKFQSEVRLIEYLILDKYERDFLHDIFIRSGLAQAKKLDGDASEESNLVLKKAKPYFMVGEEVVLEPEIEGVERDAITSANLTAEYRVGDVVEQAQISTDGLIRFVPKVSGDYEVMATFEGKESVNVAISVFNPKPIINREELEALFLDVRNPLRIEADNLDPASLEVSSTMGQIRKINDLYYIKFDKPGEVTIHVDATIDGKKVHINSRKFLVKELPIPYASLNSMRSGEILEAHMRLQRKLMVKSEVYETDNFYNVKEFRITRISGDGYEVNQLPAMNKTANFGPHAIEMVRKASKGDLFVFDEIVVVGANGKEHELQALAFKII